MKNGLIYFTFLFLVFAVQARAQDSSYTVPAGGNSRVKTSSVASKEKVTNTGWENWQDASAAWNTYIKFAKPGILKISVLLNCA